MKTKLSGTVKEPVNDDSNAIQLPLDRIIGRRKEINKLDHRMNCVTEGSGCFIVLNGEAGIGKSILKNYFAEQTKKAGFSSYSISFRNVPIYDPYQPFMTLVDKMNDTDKSSGSISSEDYSEFNLENNNDNSDSLQILQDKYTFIRQFILSRIIKHSQETPLLIILEDLHLASQSTWQFVHYLTEKITEDKVLILATLRQDGQEMTRDRMPPYAEVLKRMSRSGLVEKIKLQRFTLNDTRQFLSILYSKSDFSSEFVSLFYEVCNGIPSKIVIYTKIFEKKGFIYCERGIWYNRDPLSRDEMCETVIEQMDVIQLDKQIEKLSPARLKLLKYSALLMDSFDHLLLSEITNRPKIAVLKDLVFLSTQKILLNLENERFEFKHTSTLLAVKRKIKTQQLAEMHQKIAESLEQMKQPQANNKAYHLAHHYSQTNNKDLAFKYLFLAGNLSMQNLAFAEARIFYQKALSLADYVQQNKKLIHLYLRSAWNNRMAGYYNQSLEYIEKAYQLSKKTTKNIDINFILLQRAFTYFRLRNWVNALASFKQCLKNKKNLSSFSQATTHYGLASINFELGKYNVSRQHFEEALLLVKNIKSKPSVTILSAKILNNLGALESVTGNHIQAISRYSQSIPLYQKFDDNYGLAQVYNNIGLTYSEGKNWIEANTSFGKSLSYCDLSGNYPLKSIVFLNRSFAFTQLNRINEAEEYNIKAYRLLKKLSDPLGIAEYHKIQGIIERKEGHWEKAINHFAIAVQKFEELKNLLGYAESAFERGLLAIDMMDEKELNKWFKLSIKNYKELGLDKRAFDITKTLNGYVSDLYNTNMRKKNAIVSSL